MKKAIILTLIIITVIVFTTVIRMNKIFNDYGETTLKNEVYKRTNFAISRFIDDNVDLFENLATHEFSSNGKLASIKIDTAKLVVLQNGLEKQIINSVAEMEATEFHVPFGNLIGNKLLSGMGPNIKIKTVPLSSLSCRTVNNFESVGINHTLHRVELVFDVEFTASAPFARTEFKNTFTVTLCESIIVGEVPQVYLN